MPAPPMPTRCSRLPLHVIARRNYRAGAGVPGQPRAGDLTSGFRGPTLPCAPVAAVTAARRSLPALRSAAGLRTAAWALLASRVVVWGPGLPAVLALGY